MSEEEAGKPVVGSFVARSLKSLRNLVSQGNESVASLTENIELLSEEERDALLATKWGTVRTIINAIISAGVLGLAFRMRESGSGTVALLMLLSTVMIILTLNFLYQAGKLGCVWCLFFARRHRFENLRDEYLA